MYQIEVRATSEEYDVHAHQLAREILELPTRQLPSLAAISAGTSPLVIRTAQLYYLTGNLTPSQVNQLTQQLLIDPVIQEADILQKPEATRAGHIVDVFFHAGVTDTLAESVLTGASMLGITGLERVETGKRYVLDPRLSEDEVRTITGEFLYNPVIQHFVLQNNGVGARFIAPFSGMSEYPETTSGTQEPPLNSIPTYIQLTGMSGEQLLELSRAGLLALNLDEMRVIQQHYREQGREPTDVELETLAQTWSEHCSHKTFKATIHYIEMGQTNDAARLPAAPVRSDQRKYIEMGQTNDAAASPHPSPLRGEGAEGEAPVRSDQRKYTELDSIGNLLEEQTIDSLLKQYIMRATQQIACPWVVSAFSDNAGIIRFTQSQDIAFKVETHNHPSAIEPFGGANTGVGGVIRDVLGVSAQPIACTDILCFGPPDTPSEELSVGVLAPRRIASGVVNGVRDYGNKMGIPTVNGAVLYHEGYIHNPLVFCGCLGILSHDSHPRHVKPGDRIVVLGGRTGRDGIHGATFSSGEMSSEINARAGSAVQIGAPITEKKVADVIIKARDRQLYSAITDCGAGGFSSAIGEMAAETGARVELERAPLKYQGLAPWEIWLSEAQERMVLAVPPAHLETLLDICAIEEVEASVIGTFTGDHRLVVSYHGQIVADMDMAFLHHGRPGRTLEAVWVGAQCIAPLNTDPNRGAMNYTRTLLTLLSHPTIASKESIIRRYDHEVQGATILKPLVGSSGNGPSDAAVLQPILEEEQTGAGIVLSNGINPLYGKIDPYHMAVNAVDEALRNLTAVGGDIERTAILDNFCWGNPTDPIQLGMLVRAVKGCHDAATGFGTPFISGKDSLNNEYRSDGERLPVIPTLLISAVSMIDDASQTIDMSLKHPGNLLYQVGITRNELAGSHYLEVAQNLPATDVPRVDIQTARTTMKALGSAIRKGLVRACHDLSEGGLAVAAAEMSLAGLLGMTIDLGLLPVEDTAPEGLGYGAAPVDAFSQDELNTILLFSESASRFLVEVAPGNQDTFESFMSGSGVQHFALLGTVTETERFVVRNRRQVLIDAPVSELQEAWRGKVSKHA